MVVWLVDWRLLLFSFLAVNVWEILSQEQAHERGLPQEQAPTIVRDTWMELVEITVRNRRPIIRKS